MPHAYSVMIVFSGFRIIFVSKPGLPPKSYEGVVKKSDPLEGHRPAHKYEPISRLFSRRWRISFGLIMKSRSDQKANSSQVSCQHGHRKP